LIGQLRIVLRRFYVNYTTVKRQLYDTARARGRPAAAQAITDCLE
jgi:hypothetical protein